MKIKSSECVKGSVLPPFLISNNMGKFHCISHLITVLGSGHTDGDDQSRLDEKWVVWPWQVSFLYKDSSYGAGRATRIRPRKQAPLSLVLQF